MRTIHRDIVGGYIISADGNVLLGKSRKGGVFNGVYIVPGGGIDQGETKEAALRREMLEETGINTDDATVSALRISSGESEKTLRDTDERVLVKMDFFDYIISLKQNAEDVVVVADDDWEEPRWFSPGELAGIKTSAPTRSGLDDLYKQAIND